MAASETAPPADKVKTRKERIVEAIDMIPVIGKPCAWIYKHLGLTGFLTFLSGLLLGLGLVFFGAVPSFCVSDSYKNILQPTTPKTKPTNITVISMKDPKPDWLQPYLDWLDDEAQSRRRGPTRAGIGAVESLSLPRTEKFKWLLKAAPGFSLNAWAFRVRSDGYYKLLEPVKDQSSIHFDVPECEQGDKLVAVILATWEGTQPQVEIQDTFRSMVIEEGR